VLRSVRTRAVLTALNTLQVKVTVDCGCVYFFHGLAQSKALTYLQCRTLRHRPAICMCARVYIRHRWFSRLGPKTNRICTASTIGRPVVALARVVRSVCCFSYPGRPLGAGLCARARARARVHMCVCGSGKNQAPQAQRTAVKFQMLRLCAEPEGLGSAVLLNDVGLGAPAAWIMCRALAGDKRAAAMPECPRCRQ